MRDAKDTLDRLQLDDGEMRELRARRFTQYCVGQVNGEYLKRHSPLLWVEARRQGLL